MAGRIELSVSRERQASFDPQLIAKYQRRVPGFDDKIISMDARRMSTREIPGSGPGAGHLRDLYEIGIADSDGSRPGFRDDLARRSGMKSPG